MYSVLSESILQILKTKSSGYSVSSVIISSRIKYKIFFFTLCLLASGLMDDPMVWPHLSRQYSTPDQVTIKIMCMCETPMPHASSCFWKRQSQVTYCIGTCLMISIRDFSEPGAFKIACRIIWQLYVISLYSEWGFKSDFAQTSTNSQEYVKCAVLSEQIGWLPNMCVSIWFHIMI